MLSYYYCKKCSFFAKNPKGLELHQLEVHRFCQICDYTSEDSEEFFNHIGKNHSEVKIYECDVFCKFSNQYVDLTRFLITQILYIHIRF